MPGRGKSDWISNIKTIHDMADAILSHLPKNAIYIGWSFGGLVTFSIAARYPDRVSQIIGIATTPKFIESDNWEGVPAPGFQAGFEEIKKLGFNHFFRAHYDFEFAKFYPKPVSYHQLIQLLDNTPKQELETLLHGIHLCDYTDLRADFQTLQCPIDLLLGENDSAVPLSAHAAIKSLNDNVYLHIIPNAQHMPFWTHPAEFQDKLQNILEK
ncbi:alpha/beta fold hydrolase [Candidiatus Paracoxiella cheracis]|uniref:alpha/beta fold hydrolase n=1 Tax=Candidiatus Paracoxiella cheracis TaxID=3405120 RepID=UPI003BF51F4B